MVPIDSSSSLNHHFTHIVQLTTVEAKEIVNNKFIYIFKEVYFS